MPTKSNAAYWCIPALQIHKLEATLNWHLQNGALQDASVLQLLVMQAAADGNAAIMGMLLPMFEKMGWLVSGVQAWMSHRGNSHCWLWVDGWRALV